MHLGAVGPGDKVLLVDDLVATGATLGAGIRLIGTQRAPLGTLSNIVYTMLLYTCSVELE